ncbi:unnamed protein product [Rhodiola kirilowii]
MSSSSGFAAAPVMNATNKAYGLSESVVIIIFVIISLVVWLPILANWYFDTYVRPRRRRRHQLHRRNRNRRNIIVFNVDSGDTPTTSRGLDPSLLKSIPVFVFTDGAAADCAICLSKFEVGEKGRSLPQCHHSFHIDCIDMWFTSHSTCPLCRAPVELIVKKDATSDEENLVVVVDSESQAQSALTSSPVSDGSPADTMELKDFSIEVPRRSELTENDGFRSPARRMMLPHRILNRGLSLSSPSTVEVCDSDESCDLEAGREEPCLEPSRTQTLS